jgi:hypothetical protein
MSIALYIYEKQWAYFQLVHALFILSLSIANWWVNKKKTWKWNTKRVQETEV